jgi:hypothetical protein
VKGRYHSIAAWPRVTSLLREALVLGLLTVAAWVLLLAGCSGDAVARKQAGIVSSALNNGIVKVGIDLNAGGSISYLSRSASSYNLVNVYGKGRYIQQSYYAGQKLDRTSEGQYWRLSPYPWNPVQGGDTYRNSAPVRAWNNDGRRLYVRTQPLLWDMNGELCQCLFETWITLEGRMVRVRNKLTSFRTDSRWIVKDWGQELPAVYAIADLHRVLTYAGGQPFSGRPLTEIGDTPSFWERWEGTEHWAACVNAQNFGLGVYNPPRLLFEGGLYGSPGGGEWDNSTCYLGPKDVAAFGKRSTYYFEYYLTVGSLNEIRRDFYSLDRRLPAGSVSGQTWGFDLDGNFEGWTTNTGVARASVASGALYGTATNNDPFLEGPIIGKSASSLKKVVVRLRNNTASRRAQLFFQTLASRSWNGWKSKAIAIQPNRDFTVYTFDMSSVPAWAGTITRLRLDPADTTGSFGIDWIRIAP